MTDRFKLIKWWSQSFMVDIESIICGFRDDEGVVHQLEEFKTRNIPKIANVRVKTYIAINYLLFARKFSRIRQVQSRLCSPKLFLEFVESVRLYVVFGWLSLFCWEFLETGTRSFNVEILLEAGKQLCERWESFYFEYVQHITELVQEPMWK